MNNIPKRLDTPEKRNNYLTIVKEIEKHRTYVKYYEREVTEAKKALQKAQTKLKGLRALRDYMLKGGVVKKKGRGWTEPEREI